jgi:hypothetical protein
MRPWPLLVIVSSLAGCAAISLTQPPDVILAVPEAFRTGLSICHLAKGDRMFGDDFESMQARAPVTRYEGFWGAYY